VVWIFPNRPSENIEMFDWSRNAANFRDYSVGIFANKQQLKGRTIYTGDIREPWKSAHGFPMTAARLAAGEKLVLSCREDEVFDYLVRLNELLGSPESLKRAHRLLINQAWTTQKKFNRLLKIRDQPLNDCEIPDLLTRAEDILTGSTQPTVPDRLAYLLSPVVPIQELAGLRKMLSRLQNAIVALVKVKDHGFKVVVIERCRQPKRPVPTASQYGAGQPGAEHISLIAPVDYHLTLWVYRIVRSDQGQSAVWN